LPALVTGQGTQELDLSMVSLPLPLLPDAFNPAMALAIAASFGSVSTFCMNDFYFYLVDWQLLQIERPNSPYRNR
jgi:hypothetical protein